MNGPDYMKGNPIHHHHSYPSPQFSFAAICLWLLRPLTARARALHLLTQTYLSIIPGGHARAPPVPLTTCY